MNSKMTYPLTQSMKAPWMSQHAVMQPRKCSWLKFKAMEKVLHTFDEQTRHDCILHHHFKKAKDDSPTDPKQEALRMSQHAVTQSSKRSWVGNFIKVVL